MDSHRVDSEVPLHSSISEKEVRKGQYSSSSVLRFRVEQCSIEAIQYCTFAQLYETISNGFHVEVPLANSKQQNTDTQER